MLAKHNNGGEVVAITYSGEVYNFQDLRTELQSLGHHFDTHCDTEVVLKAYVEWGENFVDRLNGMYAFAIWDCRTQELLLIRDRLGVKPLYYFQTQDGVVFGSEPKALLANPLVPRRVTANGLREILRLVRTPGLSVFEGMREVIPGEIVRINRQGLVTRRYWRLEARKHEHNLEQTIQHTRELLEDILDKQIVSDVPLCSLLSGGLDSSIVTSLASRKLLKRGKENIHSISVGFVDHGADFVSDGYRDTPDAPYIKDLVQHVHSNHKDVILDGPMIADPEVRKKVVRALDMPPSFGGDLWPSLYCLFAEARKSSTVALSGEAADELFCGYRWFYGEAAHLESFPWMTAGKMLDGNVLFTSELLEKLDLDSFVSESYAQALAEVPHLPGESVEDQNMRRMSYLNITRFMRLLLDRMDRMSMASSVELRVPFCDHRLIEYVFNIPWEMKTFDGREKSILRAAGRDLLPDSITQRVKSPYPSTQDPSYAQELITEMARIAADDNAPIKPFLDANLVQAALNKKLGAVSLGHERQGMEIAIGLNTWMTEYNITLDI